MSHKKLVISHFIIISFWTCLTFIIQGCYTKMVSYLNVERPHLDRVDPTYFSNMSVTSKRYNRSDPYYYSSIEFNTLMKIDKQCTHSFNFYEVLSASSTKHIFELQYDFCDWAANDALFGAVFRDMFMKTPRADRPMADFKCPFIPGTYRFKNLKAPMFRIPMSFTFQNGRAIYKMSCKNKVIATGHADFNILLKNNV